MKKFAILLVVITAIFACNQKQQDQVLAVAAPIIEKEIKEIPKAYGFDLTKFNLVKGVIAPNQVLSTILSDHNIDWNTIDKLVKATQGVFDFRKVRAGQEYAILDSDPSTPQPDYLVYEKDAVNYIVMSLQDSLYAEQKQKEITIVEREVAGTIHSSLYASLMEADMPAVLAVDLGMLYAWTIDFYRIQRGDSYRVIFEEHIVEGESIGVGQILAAEFVHQDEPFLAFAFEDEYGGQYFDENGHSLKKAFLKSPIKFSRISSRFNKRRFHPVLKRVKPHLGTDYAAPHGTAILATADGVITKSSYSRGNGKYVKMRHNSTYETQYLHMSKRAVKVGDRVKQGDVIGYVGSTGLATGPHVCYRFWKNGEQVDPFKEKFPPATPVKVEHKEAYDAQVASYMKRLDALLENQPKEEVPVLEVSKTPEF